MITSWNLINFRSNTRKQHLDKWETICRENRWVAKGEPVIKPTTKPYVIMLGNTLVGYYAIEDIKGNQHLIWGLYILPQFRGKGYATITIQKIAFTMWKMGQTNCLFCYCNKDNEIAKHIYLKVGYIYGKDERLYSDFVTCRYPQINDLGEYTIVFLQKVWGEKGYTLKGALEDVFNLHTIQKSK